MSADRQADRSGALAPLVPGPISIHPMPPFGTPDLHWEMLRPGVEVAWLYRTTAHGPRAALLRYQPGATVPEHEHLDYEHIFVLQGSQSDGDQLYTAGTLSIFPPGLSHNIVSAEGCTVLAIWTGEIRFAEEAD